MAAFKVGDKLKQVKAGNYAPGIEMKTIITTIAIIGMLSAGIAFADDTWVLCPNGYRTHSYSQCANPGDDITRMAPRPKPVVVAAAPKTIPKPKKKAVHVCYYVLIHPCSK